MRKSNNLLFLNGFLSSQRGFGIYTVVLILGALGITLVAAFMSTSALQNRTTTQNATSLSQAKLALIGWAVSRNAGADRPGDLPAPDTGSETPANYNGLFNGSGCLDASKPNGLPLITQNPNVRCLGRLPWATLNLPITQPSEQDIPGNMPWYAVSANLTRIDNCLSILNSDTANWPYSSYDCGTNGNLPYPWLTVRDNRGNVISDRVAFVVITPGTALGSQQRLAPPNLAGPSQYLDTFTVPVGCAAPCVPGTYSNGDLDNEFIVGTMSDTFNDQLLYVTIDELMIEVEKRVASEVRGAIYNFAKTYSDVAPAPRYFWLAPFDPTGSSNPNAIIGTARGSLPSHKVGQSFPTAFQWSLSGNVSAFGTVTAAEVRNYSVSATNGVCTWESAGLPRVNCTATFPLPTLPLISRSITLSYTGSSATPTVSADPTHSDLVISPATDLSHTTRSVNRTTLSSVTLSITDTFLGLTLGNGSDSAGLGNIRTQGITLYPPPMPNWYATNNWHQLTYAAIAPGYAPGAGNSCSTSNCFTVKLNGKDVSTNVQGIVMTAGRALNLSPPQARHNSDPANYFDTANNQSVITLNFDRQIPLSSTFNDQLTIIGP